MSNAVLAPRAPARTMTGRWVIDPGDTAVTIRARMLGVPVRGRFDGAEGMIDVPEDITRATVSAIVPSDRFRARWAPRGRSERLLAAAVHPRLSFTAAGLRPIMESVVTPDGERPLWWLSGELTVMKVTRPLRLALGIVRLCDDAPALEFGATATLRRSDFGVTDLRGVIGDTVGVTVRGRARRESTG